MKNKKPENPIILVFGNSASGKSTFSKQLAKTKMIAHLDLDNVAWISNASLSEIGGNSDIEGQVPTRCSIAESLDNIHAFIALHPSCVIEGCYADILGELLIHASEIFFLNPGVKTCVENAKNRAWEPHKYPSLKKQNENLPMLIDWISEYESRKDEYSYQAHHDLYIRFSGMKREFADLSWVNNSL